jgi:hypothetical protein
VGLSRRQDRGEVTTANPDELTEVRWVGPGTAMLLMPDMFGPVREYLTQRLEQ